MNAFHIMYLIFSIIQVILGLHSLVMSLGIYLLMYKFGFLAMIWLLNGIWLIGAGIEEIVHSIQKGNRYRYFVIIHISL
ncbi:MAG: hypothetical protein EZS28_017315 [Streblomastix strix]|uniref:Uncharacterized protein n=1 Tax=Streblomastix strix TaxID=222440 RepID=A0A5J4VXX4_9EUKA|nr:MAG: hypothetical protein EZS28_017315 [Streblomastix strix]